jgi:hypothetical protein
VPVTAQGHAPDGLDLPEQRTDTAEAPLPAQGWPDPAYGPAAGQGYEQYPGPDYPQQYQGYPEYQEYQYEQGGQGMPVAQDAQVAYGWEQPQPGGQPTHDAYGNPIAPPPYDPNAYPDPNGGWPPEQRSGDDSWPQPPQGERQ